MSYISLYRKYRPTNFKDLAGHNNIKNILKSEIKNNSLPNSLIFVGQKGTGKTSLAKILAKIVNCTSLNIETVESCDQCKNCVMSLKNSHPDVIEMDAASNNGVEEIRNIISNVSTLPVLGKKKIFIIDEVHMLTMNAFNAFLKTLEEPPENVIFILATTEFQKIPTTILSRCQIFNFKKIQIEDLTKRLKDILDLENYTSSSEVLDEIFYLSDGSLRDALNYLEQLINISTGELEFSKMKELFSIASKKEKIEIIQNILSSDSKKIINFFESSISKIVNVEIFILQIIDIVKEIIEYKILNDNSTLRIMTKEDLNQFENISLNDFFKIADTFANAYEKTKRTNISYQYLLISILKSSFNLDKLISLDKNDQDVINNNFLNINKNDFKENIPEVIKKEIEETKIEETKIEEMKTDSHFKIDMSIFSNIEEFIENDLNDTKIFKISDSEISKMRTISKISVENLYDIKIENKKIINVLAGAKSDLRNEVTDKYEILFNSENLLPESFSIFSDFKNVATCDETVIFKSENNVYAKIANNLLQSEKFRNVFLKLLNVHQKNIFIVTKDEWKIIKDEYINLKKTNSFPDYDQKMFFNFYDNLIKHNRIITNEEDELLKRAKNFFGANNIKVVD